MAGHVQKTSDTAFPAAQGNLRITYNVKMKHEYNANDTFNKVFLVRSEKEKTRTEHKWPTRMIAELTIPLEHDGTVRPFHMMAWPLTRLKRECSGQRPRVVPPCSGG